MSYLEAVLDHLDTWPYQAALLQERYLAAFDRLGELIGAEQAEAWRSENINDQMTTRQMAERIEFKLDAVLDHLDNEDPREMEAVQ